MDKSDREGPVILPKCNPKNRPSQMHMRRTLHISESRNSSRNNDGTQQTEQHCKKPPNPSSPLTARAEEKQIIGADSKPLKHP